MKRLGLIAVAVAVVVLVILGMWLAVGRDSGPSNDALACSRVYVAINPTLNKLKASSEFDSGHEDVRVAFRKVFVQAAGSEWPNVENADLKSSLKAIAATPINDSIVGDWAAMNTLCEKA